MRLFHGKTTRRELFTSVQHYRGLFLTFQSDAVTLINVKVGFVGELWAISSAVEHQSYKLGVVGSSPTSPTKLYRFFANRKGIR